MYSSTPTPPGSTNVSGTDAQTSATGGTNQTPQAAAAAETGQPSPPDIKKFAFDLFKFLQDEGILEGVPGSTTINYMPVGGRWSGLTLTLGPATVHALIMGLVSHFVSEGYGGVDKLPEDVRSHMGEAFDHTVNALIMCLVSHFVSEEYGGVDKLPEDVRSRMGEAFDLCHWAMM